MRIQLGFVCLLRKRHMSSQSHKERCSQTVNVGSMINLAAIDDLFGCDVVRRSQTVVAKYHRQGELFVTTIL